MNTNKKGNQELVSLNSELSEFDVKELEQRLETYLRFEYPKKHGKGRIIFNAEFDTSPF